MNLDPFRYDHVVVFNGDTFEFRGTTYCIHGTTSVDKRRALVQVKDTISIGEKKKEKQLSLEQLLDVWSELEPILFQLTKTKALIKRK